MQQYTAGVGFPHCLFECSRDAMKQLNEFDWVLIGQTSRTYVVCLHLKSNQIKFICDIKYMKGSEIENWTERQQ